MLGAFGIEGPSSTAIALLWAFYALMAVGLLGLAISLFLSWRDR